MDTFCKVEPVHTSDGSDEINITFYSDCDDKK
mgnify:CR=1 FL=1